MFTRTHRAARTLRAAFSTSLGWGISLAFSTARRSQSPAAQELAMLVPLHRFVAKLISFGTDEFEGKPKESKELIVLQVPPFVPGGMPCLGLPCSSSFLDGSEPQVRFRPDLGDLHGARSSDGTRGQTEFSCRVAADFITAKQ